MQLSSISLLRLQNDDATEKEKLFQACSNDGFFYLDLRDHERLLSDYESLMDIIKRYFDQTVGEKMKDDHKSDTTG